MTDRTQASLISSDCIHLEGIRAYGYTGFFVEEQKLGQWYELELKLWLDVSKPAQTDCLDDTYDYSADIQVIMNLIRTAKFRLIERLAAAIADIILTSGKVEQVYVRLTKVNPPIPNFTGTVSIEITRTVR